MTNIDEAYDRKAAFNNWQSQARALDGAVAGAEIISGRHFMDGDDIAAKHWREVARWLKERAATARQNQQSYATRSSSL